MREEYEDLENGAPDALNATCATSNAKGPNNAEIHDSVQITRQLELESSRGLLASAKVLFPSSGNAAKRLKATGQATRRSYEANS